MRRFLFLLLLLLALIPLGIRAESAEPDPREEDEFDVMNWLSEKGLHDLNDESWNAYGQATYIYQWKPPFSALYTNLNGTPNSLLPGHETSFTATATLFFGAKLWDGGEVYAVPELIGERPLSNLKGLGSTIQNFELQKNGNEMPMVYLSRVYYKQTFDLGGSHVQLESDPMQLGTTVDSRRLVIMAGNYSVLDVFDKNRFAGDLRRQFLNMAFLSYAAYDFAADARGYSWGLSANFIYDDWSVRLGRFIAPYHPNQQTLDWNIFDYYGDQLEIEHTHEIEGLPGAIRVLGFRNREFMGKFSDAIAMFEANPQKYNATTCNTWNYGNPNAGAPDLCWARKANTKMGIGMNIEQQVTQDVGVFARGMWNDGQEEVYSFTSTDRSLSFGALMRGERWDRPRDLLGLGYGFGWISKEHARYLGLGGIDGFIGDGAIKQATEQVVDLFYSYNMVGPVWVSGDYQHIMNPAYNADRGPVNIYGVRLHAEF